MKIIACYSSKGGVGKTSAAVNLAYASAKNGRRTLLIDLDQQGASTFYFRIRPEKAQSPGSLIRSLIREKEGARSSIRECDFENLHLLAANQSYRDFDSLLDSVKKSKRRLADFIKELGDGYDRIILDCPPGPSACWRRMSSALPTSSLSLSCRPPFQNAPSRNSRSSSRNPTTRRGSCGRSSQWLKNERGFMPTPWHECS